LCSSGSPSLESSIGPNLGSLDAIIKYKGCNFRGPKFLLLMPKIYPIKDIVGGSLSIFVEFQFNKMRLAAVSFRTSANRKPPNARPYASWDAEKTRPAYLRRRNTFTNELRQRKYS
jgi:hypothetical protein